MARRILLLITDLEIGGTPTVVRELAIRLQNVEVACLSKLGPVADQLRDANIVVTAFDAHGASDLPRTVKHLINLVRDHKIDTVFSFLVHANATAAVASWFLPDVKFIQSIQTTQPNPKWHWIVQRFAQNFATKIVVPSPSAAQVARDYAQVPEEKIVVIPNAIDPADFSRSGRTEGAFRIGFLGRLDPVKRVTDLIAAMKFLDDRFNLEIFGDGEDRRNIEREIAALNLQHRVKLHGLTAKPQAVFEQIDFLVLPSQAEGFGLVLIEAMAAGVPVVATNVPGIRDVVRNDETGLLVPVASPDQLAAAIEKIADDRNFRDRLIINAKREVNEKYTWDRVLPMYRALFEKI